MQQGGCTETALTCAAWSATVCCKAALSRSILAASVLSWFTWDMCVACQMIIIFHHDQCITTVAY
jgi:hypothetical protein